ncbi:MAG TPA: hypothetical protein VOA41_08980 [Candidatus Dormibacteraeota bacterium]|nr:hypothetical protein [Candidatus Dormibacteraeota bacterium]
MRRTLSWIFCFVLFLFPHKTVCGQSANQATSQAPTLAEPNPFLRALNNGTWWNSTPAQQKRDFVDGYVAAMATVRRNLLAIFNIDKKQLVAGDPQFNARTDALLNLTGLAEHYDYDVGLTKLETGVDDFYKDPRNTRIRIELALQYVRDTLNGKNAPRDLEKQLNEWREIVTK